MIITSMVTPNRTAHLTLHDKMVAIQFGVLLIEIDIEAFKDILGSLLRQAARQGLDLSTK